VEQQVSPGAQPVTDPGNAIHQFYSAEPPSPQASVDLFAGEWSSILPDEAGADSNGAALLFDAHPIQWLIDRCGGVKNRTVLELGPLECGNSYMLERNGARRVVAVEANSHAFLRALIVKNLLDLNRTKLLFGDFVPYLDTCPNFDVVLASGVLYHMQNPLQLLVRATRVAPTLLVWSHYYDRPLIDRADPNIATKIDHQPSELAFEDVRATSYVYRYTDALAWKGFCGGPRQSSAWLPWPEITRVLEELGFRVGENKFENDHPNGPAVYFVAHRAGSRRPRWPRRAFDRPSA
jgi:hypothetical protein